MVTDTLTVKVGYYGMAADKYVEAGTYHWTELSENLALYDEAYTFYRPGDDGKYRVVVDSARGIHIDELLEYARINTDDVQSIDFHTRDQEVGAFTSFTWSELFRPRYCFKDLPMHIQAGDAWDYAVEVEPMLALEDSRVTYDVGTENVYPNFTNMGTGNRFRLLFGQTQPTESRTNQSAKYTRTVYVTLKGTPKVVQEPQELDGTIGSHTAQLTLAVSDPSLLEHLQQLLTFTSSDGSVLTIDGWTVTPDARYSDLVTVTIHYSVLQSGSAAINGNIDGLSLSASPQVKAPDTPETPGDSGSSGGTDTPAPGDPGQSDTSRENPDPNRDSTGSDSAPAEQVDDMTLALLLTGAGALLLAAAGAAMQTVYYRKERNA